MAWKRGFSFADWPSGHSSSAKQLGPVLPSCRRIAGNQKQF